VLSQAREALNEIAGDLKTSFHPDRD